MTFMIYSLNGHERMPLEKVFKERIVERTEAIAAERPIQEREGRGASARHDRKDSATQAYSAVDQLPENPAVLMAEQVMTAPVLTLTSQARITEALRQFQARSFRHLPVVSPAGGLVGIVSERDILRYLAGLAPSDRPRVPPTGAVRVEQVMTPQVLTAGVDTDVRYIARLFVEQHIGAMPVMKEGELKGIINRSDVLGAVMRHYTLELWA